MPRAQLTVRRLMIVVAIFALILGGLVARSRHLRSIGDEFDRKGDELISRVGRGEWMDKSTDEENRRLSYFTNMRNHYWQAAGYPWLPVEPDLPEPD